MFILSRLELWFPLSCWEYDFWRMDRASMDEIKQSTKIGPMWGARLPRSPRWGDPIGLNNPISLSTLLGNSPRLVSHPTRLHLGWGTPHDFTFNIFFLSLGLLQNSKTTHNVSLSTPIVGLDAGYITSWTLESQFGSIFYWFFIMVCIFTHIYSLLEKQ